MVASILKAQAQSEFGDCTWIQVLGHFPFLSYHITKLDDIFKLEQKERRWVVSREKVKEVLSWVSEWNKTEYRCSARNLTSLKCFSGFPSKILLFLSFSWCEPFCPHYSCQCSLLSNLRGPYSVYFHNLHMQSVLHKSSVFQNYYCYTLQFLFITFHFLSFHC